MRLPGDKDNKSYLEEVIRVNHAGEYGAKRIYKGQLAILKNTPSYEVIKHMAMQEEVHFQYFSKELSNRNIRPTALFPFWHVAGYLLGVGTALLGEKAAMTCTEAVEEVIDNHYKEQLSKIGNDNLALKNTIEKFRQEELDHKETATKYNQDNSLLHAVLSKLIKFSCRFSIEIAKKI